MEFLTFIGGIVIIVLVLNLRGRVQKLEQMIKSGVPQQTLTPSYQPPSQPSIPQSAIPGTLLDYIKQQLKSGVPREEIRNSLAANGWQVSDIEKAFKAFTHCGCNRS